jgi:hypothetical protein
LAKVMLPGHSLAYAHPHEPGLTCLRAGHGAVDAGLLAAAAAQRRPAEISRRDYATDLQLDNALRERLQAASEFANIYVAHFNAGRVPGQESPVSRMPERSELDGHRDDVFAAMAVVVEHLKSNGSVHAADFDGWLQGARQRAMTGQQ